jgi:hypothetical protein
MVAGVSDASILRKKKKNAHFHQKLPEIEKTRRFFAFSAKTKGLGPQDML